MPPTTPPIILLDVLLKPELPELLLLPLKVALVVAASTVLLVRVAMLTTPLLVLVKVVVTARVVLEVERETVSVAMALVNSEVAVTDPAEFVGVAVEVVKTTAVVGTEVGTSVIVEETSVALWEVVVVVSELVVVLGVVDTPVERFPVCRLWLAMAISSPSALTMEMIEKRKRNTVAN